MSKRKKLLMIVVSLMIILLVAIILGYTYAKYTNHKDVSASAATAIWSFDGAISNTESMDTTSISLAQTVNKNSVASGKIAPGTSGSFKIIIDASGSEVDMDYEVLLNGAENNKPDNLYFTCSDLVNARVDKDDSTSELIKYYSLEEMLAYDSQEGKYNMSGTINKDQNSSPRVITVNWDWPYESTRNGYTSDELDLLDTEDSGISDYTFTLSILGKQKN